MLDFVDGLETIIGFLAIEFRDFGYQVLGWKTTETLQALTSLIGLVWIARQGVKVIAWIVMSGISLSVAWKVAPVVERLVGA